MNIIEALDDDQLLGGYLGPGAWAPWRTVLRALYGLPVTSERGRDLIRQCTGRDPDKLPANGFQHAVVLVGRRSGKSRCLAACTAVFEAVLAGHEERLAAGERGVVPVIAPSKYQARVIEDYVRAALNTPILRHEVLSDTREGGIELNNRSRIQILAGDWRTIRGYTLQAAVVDEACFFQSDEDSKVKSDTELVRAIMPGLATTGGKLILVSSPHAKRGACYETYQRHFGDDSSNILVWNAASRVMNPTLPQSVVDDALRADLQAAKSEYLGEFRDDIAQFISRDLIDNLVVMGRRELMPQKQHRYFAFVDIASGARGGDDAVLAIGHMEDRKVIVDRLLPFKPPFDPYRVCSDMARELERWDIAHLVGDNYAGAFTAQAFSSCGTVYERCDKNKSALYSELLPRLCSGEIELLDNEVLLNQLSRLERRTRAGGRDKIDHPSNGHDDVANAVAGLAYVAACPSVVEVGGWR